MGGRAAVTEVLPPFPRWAWLVGLLGACVFHGALQWPLWHWEVEDAAISFAYARNLAEGLGPVAFPGAEYVEGYSNPSWTALLALGHALGVMPVDAARWVGLICGMAVVVLVAELVAKQRGRRDGVGVLAAWLMACAAPHVIWSASGLENAWMALWVGAGALLLLQRRLVSVGPWLMVALTRPEGVAYAAVAGAFFLGWELKEERRVWRSLAWAGLFWLGYGAFLGLRLWVFAWPFPMTYYAKLGDQPFAIWAWNARAFMYLRKWSAELWLGPLLGLPLLGLAGLKGRGRWLALTALLVVALVVLPDGPVLAEGLPALPGLPLPRFWPTLRGAGLAAALGLAVLAGLVGRERRPAALLGALLAVSLCFSVVTGGDWMRGYRWHALTALPLAGLTALGIGELAGLAAPRWLRAGVGLVLGAVVCTPQLIYLAKYDPEVTPESVARRLDHLRLAARLLDLERIVVLDHDLGGFMWWGPPDVSVIDARGLVDVPFGLWQRDRRFLKEGLLERPWQMVHAHASSGQALSMRGGTQELLVEIPGYGNGQRPHMGNMVKRELLLGPAFVGEAGRVAEFDGVTLHGVSVPSPEVGPGSWLYLELGLSVAAPLERGQGLQLWLFAADGERLVRSWEVVLGLPDWVPPEEWRPGEVFTGRYSVPVPDDMALGEFDLGLVLVDAEGVLAPLSVGEGLVVPEAPAFAWGELRVPGALRFVSRDVMNAAAGADVSRALAESRAGDCVAGEQAWQDARHHRVRSLDWQAGQRELVYPALAACWASVAERAVAEGDEAGLLRAGEALAKAYAYDPRLAPVAAGQAEALAWRLSERAYAAGDVGRARELALAGLAAKPSAAWLRRRAERLRAEAVGLPW